MQSCSRFLQRLDCITLDGEDRFSSSAVVSTLLWKVSFGSFDSPAHIVTPRAWHVAVQTGVRSFDRTDGE